jgi:hypothetical protein
VSVTCPDGHTSTATDFCDVCGAPIGANPTPGASSPAASGPAAAGAAGAGAATGDPASAPAAGAAAPEADGGGAAGGATGAAPAATTLCPNCGTAVSTDALFCEGCGRDMVTGQLPTNRPPTGGPDEGTPPPRASTGWVAEVWVDEEWFAARGEGRCPTVGEPATFPVADGSLIGRRSKSRNIHPDVDCSADGSVSARQALLGFNGTIWTITDLGSTNGTYIAHAGGPLPADPIAPDQAVELETGDRILVGAHTRVVILPEAPAAPPAP